MGGVNDMSFIFADVLAVLIEHQSIINPNMPNHRGLPRLK
jgi:hypothetical protein